MDPGEYVIDADDDAPDLAVVVHRLGVSIAEIPVTGGDAERSVAADNPAYEPGEPAVVVAFVEAGLTQFWPDWLDHRAEGSTLEHRTITSRCIPFQNPSFPL